MPRNAGAQLKTVLVWDLPTRIVHWSFSALVLLLWWTSDSEHMVLHKRLGFAILALVTFRIYWGFCGSETARFSDFLRGPRAVLAYLLRGISPTLGHNPLGALSVIALLSLLFFESALGLFAIDEDGLEPGPLSIYLSFENGQRATHYHALVFDLLLGFIALHILAVVAYLARGQDLIVAMLSGRKRVDPAVAAPRTASTLSFACGIALSTALFGLLCYLDGY